MSIRDETALRRDLVNAILLGPAGDRRQLQDSPLLGDVWMAFAENPSSAQDLLITPYHGTPAGVIASQLHELVRRDFPQDLANIAYLQGLIAARLYFHEVLLFIVPWTSWWTKQLYGRETQVYRREKEGRHRLENVFDMVLQSSGMFYRDAKTGKPVQPPSAFERYAVLAAIILWAGRYNGKTDEELSSKPSIDYIWEKKREILNELQSIFGNILSVNIDHTPTKDSELESPRVFQVALNREATISVCKSVSTVKADAARRLFNVDCSNIAWAIIDSGIQGDHAAFADRKSAGSRVVKSYDFRNIAEIVSLDNLRIAPSGVGSVPEKAWRRTRLDALLNEDLKNAPSEEEAVSKLWELAMNARSGHPINWELVRPFIEIKTNARPEASDHGTHVAGIIGASKPEVKDESEYTGDGLCPEIKLYDFRVMGSTLGKTEFAIIAALQFIRYLNQRHDHITIHGANLSLSIPHDVRNYACGRTPVCDECERLVESGTTVVVAAGNRGYHEYETRNGPYAGYAAFSITDPGNADGVITVGATHRTSPHGYGVSFFSSRGPTGDGRLKPDLVAPGERIRAPTRDGWGDLDGTSMAAPHVSGAAAMLMARYPEFRGQPRRIKQILCESATDLGRERSFQGHGLLDVLRAFQKI